MNTYKSVVMGCSRMGAFIDNEVPESRGAYSHAAGYEACERTHMIACSDLREEVMEQTGRRYGVPREKQYLNYEEMIDREKPDILSVATQPEQRAEIVIFAVEHGVKAIYAEKALAASLAEADAIVEAAERNGAFLNMGTNRRWDPGYDTMKEVVSRVIGATQLPVTVKTRLGWDQESIRIVEVAKMLEDIGVQALVIHCRTRAQGHKGAVDYEWIPRVKDAVSIPIILNGDVVSPQIVKDAFDSTGCDGVMIGRGAISHPWIFREAQHYLKTGELLPEPTLKERAELCIKHVNLAVEHDGERYALIGMRRHYAGYFRGLRGASRLRAELSGYKELAPLMTRLEELRDIDPERIAA